MNDRVQRAIELPADREAFLEWAASVDEGIVSAGGHAARNRRLKAAPPVKTLPELSTILKLTPRKLQELAGLIALRDSRLSMAAVRFAARSEPTAQLDAQEHDAFEEFVQALAEAID